MPASRRMLLSGPANSQTSCALDWGAYGPLLGSWEARQAGSRQRRFSQASAPGVLDGRDRRMSQVSESPHESPREEEAGGPCVGGSGGEISPVQKAQGKMSPVFGSSPETCNLMAF